MITPQRAPVKPRVVASETGDAVLLDELVSSYAEKQCCGAIELIGTAGAGKSRALAHLASLPFAERLTLIDDARLADVWSVMSERLVVYTVRQSLRLTKTQFRLAPWGNDDLIEYLLATHPEKCASVMARFSADSWRPMLAGAPSLYCLIAEQMAADESVGDIRTALRRGISQIFGEGSNLDDISYCAGAILLDEPVELERRMKWLKEAGVGREFLEQLQHRPVCLVLAANRLLDLLKQNADYPFPDRRLPLDLVEETARLASADAGAMSALRSLITNRRGNYAAMVASVLHMVDPAWRPHPRQQPDLHGAYLMQADWPEIDLRKINLEHADLSRSNLRGANLNSANLNHAVLCNCQLNAAQLRKVLARDVNFSQADLQSAFLERGLFCQATFAAADLSGVNAAAANFSKAIFEEALLCNARLDKCDLQGASFDQADLRGAALRGAKLRLVCLREAQLAEADFTDADLTGADLELVQMPRAKFAGANLSNSTLTGSRMYHADFAKADLSGAKLADIDWELADLRNADLSSCTFHFGSSRSGLVGSPYPGHGSKTGFYSDDFGEQTHKAPEEIRKANLRGADLQGARIENTDFYLVDLRDAKYDAEQAAHFRRCDAILCSRVP